MVLIDPQESIGPLLQADAERRGMSRFSCLSFGDHDNLGLSQHYVSNFLDLN